VNGPQDLGGQMGFGPIANEANEPIFHADWERRALGIVIAAGGMGHWSIDESRHARENRHPADYYGSSYYEIWIKGLEALLRKHGFITAADLAAGRPIDPAPAPRRVLHADAVPALVANGSPYNRPLTAAPRFVAGDRVRTLNMNPTDHTRLPRYARGKTGTIAAAHGGFVFADDNARSPGSLPQHLYTVVFTGNELWGPDGDPASDISIDAWESYLDFA
jgi:nitrile hydratase beta subunit